MVDFLRFPSQLFSACAMVATIRAFARLLPETLAKVGALYLHQSWTETMRRWFFYIVVTAATIGPAHAADPIGEWTVADGVARIGIDICNGKLWGIVTWEKEPGGVDSNNPDPARRTEPTLGMPVLIDMASAGEARWEGQIYNAKNGKSYNASVTLVGQNDLKVEGCLLSGFLCGGETWKRFARVEGGSPPAPAGTRPPPATNRRDSGTRPGAASAQPQAQRSQSAICAAVAEGAGPAHKSRLK
jgi:uncharacterized protein (DUF2147 family)